MGVIGIGGDGLVCLASRNLTPRIITATVATTKPSESTRIMIDFPDVALSVGGDATKGTRSDMVLPRKVKRGMDKKGRSWRELERDGERWRDWREKFGQEELWETLSLCPLSGSITDFPFNIACRFLSIRRLLGNHNTSN